MIPPNGKTFTSKVHSDTYDFIDPTKLNLVGHNVLVTGASRGLGKAIAISFAKAGASGIILLARSDLEDVKWEVAEAAMMVGRPLPLVHTIQCDTSNCDEVEHAVEAVSGLFETVDILVNNAGVFEKLAPVANSDPLEWWKTFETNVKGLYLMCRSFLPLVLKSELKTIIQLTSIGALIATPGASAYENTKLAIIRFNNHLMAEYGKKSLLAYAIHPGAVMSELSLHTPKGLRMLLTDRPELCGDTIAWLSSERRSWLADRYVSVTWDMQELLSRKEEIVSNELLKIWLRV